MAGVRAGDAASSVAFLFTLLYQAIDGDRKHTRLIKTCAAYPQKFHRGKKWKEVSLILFHL